MKKYVVIGNTGEEWELEAEGFNLNRDFGTVLFHLGKENIAVFVYANIIGFYEVE